jgi:hypothetical protein
VIFLPAAGGRGKKNKNLPPPITIIKSPTIFSLWFDTKRYSNDELPCSRRQIPHCPRWLRPLRHLGCGSIVVVCTLHHHYPRNTRVAGGTEASIPRQTQKGAWFQGYWKSDHRSTHWRRAQCEMHALGDEQLGSRGGNSFSWIDHSGVPTGKRIVTKRAKRWRRSHGDSFIENRNKNIEHHGVLWGRIFVCGRT